MDKTEFISLIGQDIVVDYPFYGELQQWDMKTFYIDDNGEIHHNRLPLIIDVFIKNAKNPIKIVMIYIFCFNVVAELMNQHLIVILATKMN